MKKKLVVFLSVGLMVLSFAIPAMASEIAVKEPVQTYEATEHEIAPRSEMTRVYWRTYNGVLQFRIWGMTSGRWLTDWTDAI